MKEFINLTNGIVCLSHVETPRFMRLQSTWCEQKRWADILWNTSPDLLMALAQGEVIVIHDKSERPRRTRACWQGVTWLEIATSVIWGRDVPSVPGRGGPSMRRYLLEQVEQLDQRTVTAIGYYGKFCSGGLPQIVICDGGES